MCVYVATFCILVLNYQILISFVFEEENVSHSETHSIINYSLILQGVKHWS